MKLLVGSIASGKYGLLTKEMREKLESLDLRKFCEKDIDAARDVIGVIVQVGERGRATVTGSETPKKIKESELVKTPRLKTRTGRIPGNDLERTPTPRKRRPVLVLPVAAETDNSQSSADEKDSGWDGSTLGVFSQKGQNDNNQGGIVGADDYSRTANLKSGRTIRAARSSSRVPSSASCSPISPSFLERFSVRVNTNVDRFPAPPPYSEEDRQDGEDEGDNFETPKQRRVASEIDLTPKATPVKRLFAERVRQRDAKTDRFGEKLLSSQEEEEKKSSRGSISSGRNGAIDMSKEDILCDGATNKDDEEKSQGTWVTEEDSGAESRRSFPSLAKENALDTSSRKKPFTPIRIIRWDADGAAYVPLPLSRPTSPVSAMPHPKTGNDISSRSPLPFPPSLLRTMHWATSLPTPPLSPSTQKAQKMNSQLAASARYPNTPSRTPKPRKLVAATLQSPIANKKRGSGKKHGTSGSPIIPKKSSGKSDLVVEVPENDNRDEWASIDSRERLSRQASERSQFSQISKDERDQLPLSFATTLVQPESDGLVASEYSRDIYGNERDSCSETDNDSDDRTTLYSVSTVSWGEDDPFTAALRLKRQIASEKLREVEQSFSNEIERRRIGSPGVSVTDRLRWRASAEDEAEEDSTDSDGGLTDVEEELRVLEEIGRKESIRQGFLLQRLMERGA